MRSELRGAHTVSLNVGLHRVSMHGNANEVRVDSVWR
jgi:hypothetical protein